jgi:hypothetical protein
MPATLPRYELMHSTLVREPFHRDGWVYEEKVDGWRILAYKDVERLRLVSQNGRDHAPLPQLCHCHRQGRGAHARARRGGRDLRSAASLALRLAP